MLRKLLPAILISVILFSCDDTKRNDEVNNKKPSASKDSVVSDMEPKPEKTIKKIKPDELKFTREEKNFLATLDTLSLGKRFEDVKKSMPSISDLKPEGGTSQEVRQGLSESKSSTTILSHPADVEFNYRNDTLYSYYVLMTDPDYENADKLFDYLYNHYSKKYGECKKEKVEEENKFIRNCAWQVGNKFMSMTYNINSGTISWGYQDVNPL